MTQGAYIASRADFEAVANAIRERCGTSELLVWPGGFVDAIGGMTGGGLSLSVVGGTAQPANPEINTIWVETEETVTGWSVSPAEPENPTEGFVWVLSGSGTLMLDVSQDGSLVITLNGCRQYIDGQWVGCGAKVWNGSEWLALDIAMYLIVNGKPAQTIHVQGSGTVHGESDGYYEITLGGSGSWAFWFDNMDLTEYGEVEIEGQFTEPGSCTLALWKSTSTTITSNSKIDSASLTSASGGSLNISEYTGEYKVGGTLYGNSTHKIKSLKLKKL
ncbi:MAG: hypothetical protein IJ381_07980 [Clostridia bacterium]|nr:hypothetical protein [Clostridia bacterium]